jgi:two-component system nitrate/nitrite response regulator NarL
MARLVLGNDQVLFLDALAAALSKQGHVVAAVAPGSPELVARVRREQPPACLIGRQGTAGDDARMTQIIARVLAASHGTRVIVLSANPASQAAARAVQAGASGYLHQSQGIGALTSAIERVLRGEVVIGIPEAGASRSQIEPDHALRLAGHLTGRERECLMMLVEGLDTVSITRRLGVSRTTVRTHLQSVLTKLGVHSRLEAVSFAVRHRLPDLWPESGQPGAAGSPAGPAPARIPPRTTVPGRRQPHPADAMSQHAATG